MKTEWKRWFWRGWRTEFAPRNFFSIKDWLPFLVGWPIMLECLEVVALVIHPLDFHPLLRDMSWNWLNPWATGCPQLGPSTTDFSRDYCYGTNAGHFGGPYSIMYYWLMYALALGGRYYPYINNLTIFVFVNFFFVWRIRRQFPGYRKMALINALYSWTAWMFLLAWPQVLLSFYLTAGSIIVKNRWTRASLLISAPMIRFPIGAPLYVWTFILKYSANVPGNYPPYAATIIFWLVAFGLFWTGWKPREELEIDSLARSEQPLSVTSTA